MKEQGRVEKIENDSDKNFKKIADKDKAIETAFEILLQKFPGYERRQEQLGMANAVWDCMRNKKRLLVEAGTGVGKSFAYLIPAILSKRRTIISTASIALQDQLVNKDLVFLQQALPHEFSYAILKGKNNYLCVKREKDFSELSGEFMEFREWVSGTTTGDKDELASVPDFWSRVCGDSDDCNVLNCPYYKECFYYRHYSSLYKKDILVVNHHLLIFDLLSEFRLLPFHDQLVIDEAHQIEDVISHVMGSVLSHSRIVWLLYRLRRMKMAVDQIFEPVELFFKGHEIPSRPTCPVPDEFRERLKSLKSILDLNGVAERLDAFSLDVLDDELADKILTTKRYVFSLSRIIDDFILQGDKDRVYYMAWNKGYVELKSSLVESGGSFCVLASGYESTIMTSATLTAGGSFDYLRKRLGIADFEEMSIGSPFDYRKQALLYIEKDLPAPDKDNNALFMKGSISVIERLIKASGGRALVLFTSYKHLNYVAENISIDFPCKSQGKMSPARLIQWFKRKPRSVLLATATFWQGIDIRGEDLSLVIIVKMPFGSPGEPVYDERCRRLGERWFAELALPQAILMLRQGFGRLIRSSEDYGVAAILDSRLLASSYGRIIISSLPDINISNRLEDVQKFFDSIRNDTGKTGYNGSNAKRLHQRRQVVTKADYEPDNQRMLKE